MKTKTKIRRWWQRVRLEWTWRRVVVACAKFSAIVACPTWLWLAHERMPDNLYHAGGLALAVVFGFAWADLKRFAREQEAAQDQAQQVGRLYGRDRDRDRDE